MAYKKNYKRRAKKRKYSLNQRLDYHSKRWDSAASRQKDSKSVFGLLKSPKIAYSVGFLDGVDGNTQFSEINKHGGNEKAYSKGVKAGTDALIKSRDAKF